MWAREVQFHIRGKQELDSQDDPRRLEKLSACPRLRFSNQKRERGGAGLAAHALCVCEQSSGTVVTWSKDRLGGHVFFTSNGRLLDPFGGGRADSAVRGWGARCGRRAGDGDLAGASQRPRIARDSWSVTQFTG
eukprot:m.438289 g.438289  ORF g.438289 m.438289 type:complete len:134 (-) comp18220_c0_seq1:3196-3597(-)